MKRKNKYIINIYMNTLIKEFKSWYDKVEKMSDPTRNMLTQHSLEETQPYKVSIPRQHYICGLVSQEVYKNPSERMKSISNFYLDESYNYDRTVVYKTRLEQDDIFIIGIRGTAKSTLDVATDLLIALGKDNMSLRKNAQVNLIQGIVNNLVSQGYTIQQCYITGQSLGGLIAAYCIERIPEIIGVGFNVGSSPAQIKFKNLLSGEKQILSNREDNLRFINYHMENDIISSASVELFTFTVIIKPRPAPKSEAEAHSMGFFLKSTSPNPYLGEF
jgi:hypothetical protein